MFSKPDHHERLAAKAYMTGSSAPQQGSIDSLDRSVRDLLLTAWQKALSQYDPDEVLNNPEAREEVVRHFLADVESGLDATFLNGPDI